jgi:hypothetical protein
MKMRIGKGGTIINVEDRAVERMKSMGWQEIKPSKPKSKAKKVKQDGNS